MLIRSVLKEYCITIEHDYGFVNQLHERKYSFYVIDRKVYELYQNLFVDIPEESLFLLDAFEENKTIDTVLAICERMTGLSAKRNATLISFGGGIVQDITGFVANILYRGIHWIFVPTTLLAACDSCIGGKTSLNYKGFKNLLGTFYPPDQIYVCPTFFKTLSQADFESGMGEVVKFNIMTGMEGIQYIEKKMSVLLTRDEEALTVCVEKCHLFKKKFIEIDEFDHGERVKLNFAHTFGHAIETVTEYRIPHGTAVAIGMIMADYISVERGLLKQDTADRSNALLLQIININVKLLEISEECFVRAMKKDKKQVNDQMTAVLMTDIPEDLKLIHDLSTDEIAMALKYAYSLLGVIDEN